MNLINSHVKRETRLSKDIDEFKKTDPTFRICIVSHSSKQAMSINADLICRYPELNIKIQTGAQCNDKEILL